MLIDELMERIFFTTAELLGSAVRALSAAQMNDIFDFYTRDGQRIKLKLEEFLARSRPHLAFIQGIYGTLWENRRENGEI